MAAAAEDGVPPNANNPLNTATTRQPINALRQRRRITQSRIMPLPSPVLLLSHWPTISFYNTS